jgi:flagellar operon protein
MADMLTKLFLIHNVPTPQSPQKINRIGGHGLSFAEVLKSRLEEQTGMTFSSHAVDRLQERGIILEHDDLERLSSAVTKAEEKGANESLILMNDMAFIVNIKNRTVVTAMVGDSLRENIFTNIDSTVIV